MMTHRHFKEAADPKTATKMRSNTDDDTAEVIKSAATDQMLIESPDQDPLGSNLGKFRILRTSPLTPVPDACCKDCTTYTMRK